METDYSPPWPTDRSRRRAYREAVRRVTLDRKGYPTVRAYLEALERCALAHGMIAEADKCRAAIREEHDADA